MKWIKIGRMVSAEGTTNVYRLYGTDITVESRKRAIPHSARSGTWDYTSYFVLDNGKEIREVHSLKAAKAYAEITYETQREMGVI